MVDILEKKSEKTCPDVKKMHQDICRIPLAGKFGVIDLGIPMSELKTIIKRGEINE